MNPRLLIPSNGHLVGPVFLFPSPIPVTDLNSASRSLLRSLNVAIIFTAVVPISFMASWLKAAEDLLEVVDRRAKLVASELSDEQSDSQASVSKGQKVKSRKQKSKEQDQPRKTVGRTEQRTEAELKWTSEEEFNLKVVKIDDSGNGNASEIFANHTSEALSDVLSDVRKDTGMSNAAFSCLVETADVENDNDELTLISTTVNNDEITYSTTNYTAPIADFEKGEGPKNEIENHLVDDNPRGSAVNMGTSLEVIEARQELETTQKHDINDDQETQKTLFPRVSPITHRLVENKTNSSLTEVQDQIADAQGLLKVAVSTGHSKEARLAKVCAGLSSRLQEYKSENAQLEELLIAERELNSSYEARIKQLQQDLFAVKTEATRVETNMVETLAAKNGEIESLIGAIDDLKKQVRTSEGKFISLQENMEAVMRNRELMESRIVQALREELAIVERRAEEERAAHNATKMSAVEREVELEHRAVEASDALSSIQRIADESTSRAAELEHKVALLEVECASLSQELQDLEARNRRGQKKVSEESNQILKIQAWQEEVERAREYQRESENKISSMEAELQKMRVVMAGMKRDAEHYSRQEHMELEKRYRELTDLLYYKQTQLEAMASEKAAASIHLEKEIKRLQDTRVEAERSGASRRSSALWEEDTDIKALEPLPLHHKHAAAACIQLQRAAKILDSGAVRATRFLWRYPIARVLLLIYLVFIHLFLMYLLHRLQAQAEDFSSREVAESMGLGNSSLP